MGRSARGPALVGGYGNPAARARGADLITNMGKKIQEAKYSYLKQRKATKAPVCGSAA